MILAIELCLTDSETGGQVVYTSKIATFEHESAAMEFAKDNVMLIDCHEGKVIKMGSVEIECIQ